MSSNGFVELSDQSSQSLAGGVGQESRALAIENPYLIIASKKDSEAEQEAVSTAHIIAVPSFLNFRV